MNHDLKQLLDNSEKIRRHQEKIISNQQQQISELELINSKYQVRLTELEAYVVEITADYDEVVSICKEQQAILNSLSKH